MHASKGRNQRMLSKPRFSLPDWELKRKFPRWLGTACKRVVEPNRFHWIRVGLESYDLEQLLVNSISPPFETFKWRNNKQTNLRDKTKQNTPQRNWYCNKRQNGSKKTVLIVLIWFLLLNYIAPCTKLAPPAHGSRSGEGFRHGASVMFYCTHGYIRVGASPITCNDGKWNNPTPVCKG